MCHGPGVGRDDYKWMNGQNMCFDKWSNGEPNDGAQRHPIYMYSDASANAGLYDDWNDDRKPLCEYRCTCLSCTTKTTDRGVLPALPATKLSKQQKTTHFP